MWFCRIVLVFAALNFAGFGGWLALRPEALEELLGIAAADTAARIELSAFYGGLELGLAVFFCVCAARARWHVPGCYALAAGSLGIGLVRAVGMIVTGTGGSFLYGALAFELGLGAAALWAAGRRPSSTP